MSNPLPSPAAPPVSAAIDPYTVRPIALTAFVPAPFQPWLNLAGSMTREIGLRHQADPEVHPGHQGPDRLAAWEAALLETSERRCHAREVTLTAHGCPVVQARTVARFGDAAVEMLRGLNRRPLAEVLFQDPRWQRLGRPLPLRTEGGFGRACVWCFGRSGRSRILVEEYFLPALLQDRCSRSDQTRSDQTRSDQTLNRNRMTSPSWTT